MKAFSFIIFASLLFPSLFIYSQTAVKPSDYKYLSEREIVLSDDFDKFNNYWLLGTEENSWMENIENNQLYFQSLTNKPKEDLLPVIIDTKRDFEIETSIKFERGDMEKGYGLQWGKTTNPVQQFDFLLTGNGHFTIDKYTGEFFDFVPFTLSEIVNRYAPNKLTIQKVKDVYYFFLNEHLVHSMPFQPFYGNLMGFQVSENSTILVDYFLVRYLDKAESPKSKVLIMDYKTTTVGDKVSKGIPITLSLNLKNVGDKPADNLVITYKLPENIETIEFNTVNKLNAGGEALVKLQFFANKNYSNDSIPVAFFISGADISNANDISFNIGIDQPVKNEVDKNMAQNYSQFRGGSDPLKGLNVAQAMSSVQVGEYYALIVGINKYSGEWPQLQNAVNDAKGVEEVIREKYNFGYIKALYDTDATRDNILAQFELLMTNVKPNDNVLIYYSGHGEYNETMGKGFWVPIDANSKSMSKYISNEDIKSFLAGIKSKHTLLVTDACFSGDIFRGKTMTIPYENSTKYYQKMYTMSSRKALTSGGVEPVMDKGMEGHSIFTYYFLKALSDNTEKYIDAGQLFNTLKIPVVNNSYQTPEYSPVKNTGDEGGQFIFIKKEN
jgi:hypothetical protein